MVYDIREQQTEIQLHIMVTKDHIAMHTIIIIIIFTTCMALP